MCIHMHHSDVHLDHVSYSMGVFRAMGTLINLLILIMTDHHCTY